MTDTIGICRNCAGCGWVCENHRDTPWSGLVQQETECCGGAGSPCGACNLEMASAGYVDRAITAHTKALIEGAGELEQRLLELTCDIIYDEEKTEKAMLEAAATIAAQKAEIERLTEREAQAKLDGVRALDAVAASALPDTKADSDGDDGA